MTTDYYNRNAVEYSKETISAEFQERRNMLLKYLNPNAHILDLGCGSGRDSKAFIQQGYQVTAMDGSNELCKIASKYIVQPVICRRFQDLRESNTYDAVWASASLLHVPLVDLSNIFSKVAAALKAGGYFYGSFKYGEYEGERNGRCFTDLTEEKLKALLGSCVELELVEVEITGDVREGRGEELWLNFVVRRV